MMNEKIKRFPLFLWLALLALIACQGPQGRDASVYLTSAQVDSLNANSYALRYKNLDSAEYAATLALQGARRAASRAEALNQLGFCAFMRMDFPRADSLYTAASRASMNELERLVADIGHMKICQRTVRYKSFCDYRNAARQRLRRIDDDGSLADSPRLAYARSELAIASSVYYYYLQQQPQALEAIQSIPVDETLQRDTAQWLYYLYMRGSGGLAEGRTPEEVTLAELDYLWPCLALSYRQGYTYFDANASQAMAEMMCVPEQFALVSAQRPSLMKMLNPNDLTGPELALVYARRALQGFERYGDPYQISGSLRTIATCLNRQGLHAEALDYLQRALQQLDSRPDRFYLGTDRLREQLSVTYAALGMKQQSDYNRNIYLDLLDFTRQDKETESRYTALLAENHRLNLILLSVALILVALLVVAVLVNRIWRRRNWRYIYRLQHVAQLCRRISSAQPDEAAAARAEMFRLKDSFPQHLSHDERLQAEVIDAYLSWYDEAGQQLLTLQEERECVEKERYVHQRHLEENKRENLDKKACLLVVTGILPFLDRAIYAMRRVKKNETEQLAYIDELLARINEYNDILALWIKMKPGALSLHIEAFALQPLFDTVSRGRHAFEQRRQQLTVQPTAATVKADKALTLFMLNTLADNARKYTPAGSHIQVSATETADYVELSVADDGPGMPAEQVERLMSQKVYDAGKGHGFGLMNCRGIIEKYRKTHALFRLCTFGVDSAPGRGSRFYFRLPKSVQALIVSLLLSLPLAAHVEPPQAESLANHYAEQVYQCNVDGYYAEAILYADSALQALNTLLPTLQADTLALPELTLEGRGEAPELQWLAAGVDTDYFILLDVRNEAAVAYLALGEMEKYRYNNDAYTSLYKQLTTDRSLEDYCRRMQRSSGAKTVLLMVALLLVLALVIASYLRYFHHRLIYRDRMEEILTLSRRLLHQEVPASADPVVNEWMQQLIAQRAHYDRECLLAKHEDIDDARNEVNRLIHEENRLHVQNRVLDNCLSALKHETVYYPHRIRQWVEKERAGAPENSSPEAMLELMIYYKEIYTTLTACALRQFEEVTFHRAALPVAAQFDEARQAYLRLARRLRAQAVLQVDASQVAEVSVTADAVQLQYLFLNLFRRALTLDAPGQLTLTARADGAFVRFTFLDPRPMLTPAQCASLFDPHLSQMRYVEGDRLTGVELLICKQIIRDHDAYARRGCRIQAQPATPEGGLLIEFTLPINS
jgi:signal transduction histidine kinase